MYSYREINSYGQPQPYSSYAPAPHSVPPDFTRNHQEYRQPSPAVRPPPSSWDLPSSWLSADAQMACSSWDSTAARFPPSTYHYDQDPPQYVPPLQQYVHPLQDHGYNLHAWDYYHHSTPPSPLHQGEFSSWSSPLPHTTAWDLPPSSYRHPADSLPTRASWDHAAFCNSMQQPSSSWDPPPPRTYDHDATGQRSSWDVNFPSYELPPQPFQTWPASTYCTPDPPPPPAPEPPYGMPSLWRLPTWDLSVVPSAVHTVSITSLDDPQIDGVVEVCSPEKLGDDAPMAADCSWSDGEGDREQGMQDLEIPQSLEKSAFGGANWETSHKLHACILAKDMDQSPIDGDQNMGQDFVLPAGSNWEYFLIPGVAIVGVGGLFYLIHHHDEKRAVAKGKGEKFERSAIQGSIIGSPFSLVDTEGRIVTKKYVFDPGGDMSSRFSPCFTSSRCELFVVTWYPP